MQFFERLTELPRGQMTKPEVIESSVGESMARADVGGAGS